MFVIVLLILIVGCSKESIGEDSAKDRLNAILNKDNPLEYKIKYNLKLSPPPLEWSITQYFKEGKIKEESMNQVGQGMITYVTGETIYSCNKFNKDKPWGCWKRDNPNVSSFEFDDFKEDLLTILNEFDSYEVAYLDDRTILDQTVECYEISGFKEAESDADEDLEFKYEYCFTSDGITLYSKQWTHQFVAIESLITTIEFSRNVPDSDFELPTGVEIKDMTKSQ